MERGERRSNEHAVNKRSRNTRERTLALLALEALPVVDAHLLADRDLRPLGDVDGLLADEAARVRLHSQVIKDYSSALWGI